MEIPDWKFVIIFLFFCTESLKRSFRMQAIMSFCGEITPILVILFTFIVYSTTGNDLTADAAFVSIYIFSRLRIPLTLAPTAITKVIQISVSLNRLQTLMLAEESTDELQSLDEDSKLSLAIDSATFAWTNDAQPSLKDFSMFVNKGELVAVGKCSKEATMQGTNMCIHFSWICWCRQDNSFNGASRRAPKGIEYYHMVALTCSPAGSWICLRQRNNFIRRSTGMDSKCIH